MLLQWKKSVLLFPDASDSFHMTTSEAVIDECGLLLTHKAGAQGRPIKLV